MKMVWQRQVNLVKNYVVFCLDSCRHDLFLKANTPNFDSLGETRKVYSVSGFTVPSVMSMFMNMPQYNEGRTRWLDVGKTPTSTKELCWLPTYCKEWGYYTACYTANSWLLYYNWVFGEGFDEFTGFDKSVEEIVDKDIELFKTRPRRELFIFNLFTETHMPYYGGSQVAAIEYCDRELGRLLKVLSSHLLNTEVVVCADHADVLEEEQGLTSYVQDRQQGGHGPIEAVFHPKVFEVPLVRGIVKGTMKKQLIKSRNKQFTKQEVEIREKLEQLGYI